MDRILVTEKIAGEGLELLRRAAEVDVRLDLDSAGLLAAIGEYDALVVRSATKVTAELIEAGTKLRAIGRAGTGVDNIDVEAATRRGIIVVNAPASNNVASCWVSARSSRWRMCDEPPKVKRPARSPCGATRIGKYASLCSRSTTARASGASMTPSTVWPRRFAAL